ncbi:cupin domain-containing protein [Streptomyces sp. NBC_00059]|uniref:cupin domain-containing protein n=1 Tax=Streptomyces sp. NBC_00059 TaxID=2975635 RepID=UPI00224E1BC1|nr:cupin domain-containing protein [Streptomyces sp. NBC_00059]MCX5415531.1 cupin domain-containing protein [Streptomyces sp. NBC_00059]
MSGRPPFPGATSISRLTVYDWPAPDGAGLVGSGTPHLHTASSEGYVVIGGEGAVQTLGKDGYAEHRLFPGVTVWFTPGVVHRLVNDGDLEILVVMSNAGLPEAGDAVLTFPEEVLADRAAYRAAAALPDQSQSGPDDPRVAEAARRRRDLALAGYAKLRDRVDAEGGAGLAGLHAAAGRLVADRVPAWQAIVRSGVERSTAGTVSALAALATGGAGHLADAAVAAQQERPGPARYGMCGRLRTWPL